MQRCSARGGWTGARPPPRGRPARVLPCLAGRCRRLWLSVYCVTERLCLLVARCLPFSRTWSYPGFPRASSLPCPAVISIPCWTMCSSAGWARAPPTAGLDRRGSSGGGAGWYATSFRAVSQIHGHLPFRHFAGSAPLDACGRVESSASEGEPRLAPPSGSPVLSRSIPCSPTATGPALY